VVRISPYLNWNENRNAFHDNTDWHNAIWTVMYNFWSDPNQTADDAVKALHENYDEIFG